MSQVISPTVPNRVRDELSQESLNVQRSDRKAKVMVAFQQLLAERQRFTSQVATKEEEAEEARNREALDTASQYTTDTIVRGLADLQLEFGTVVSSLTEQVSTETEKLDDLKRAIAVETAHLRDLQQVRIVADALDLLRKEHQERLRQLDQRIEAEQEALEKEQVDTRKGWEKEQAEFEAIAQERENLRQRERQWREDDYAYETERSRKIEADDYDESRRQTERQIQETTQTKEKDWAEREQVLADNQAKLAEYQQQVDAFEAELEDAKKKAREEAIRETNTSAKVKADLFEKEWEASEQAYELQIQSLERKIEKQTTQIAEISAQLQTTLTQAQELAMRAFNTTPSNTRP